MTPGQRRRFIVAGMQRSGTTVTHVCLKDHPNVTMTTDEVLPAPFFTKGLAAFTGGKESYQERKKGFLGLFDLITSLRANEKTLACGLKTAIGTHDDAIDFANCLREYLPGVRVILVTRDDLVAQHGSLLRAEQSGEWHSWEGHKSTREQRVRIEPEHFAGYAREARRTVAQLRTLASTHPLLEFRYEQDIEPGVRHERLFEFLGVPAVAATWLKMSKVAPPPESFIEGYAELRALLAAIPEPTAAEELAQAQQVRRARAAQELPNFLLHRACELLEHGQIDEACLDLETALHNPLGRAIDASPRAHAFGLLEHALAEAGDGRQRQLLDRLAQGCTDNAYFLLGRARVRARKGRPAAASEDLVQALTAQRPLDGTQRRHAFELLETVLEARGDLVAAEAAVATLGVVHAGDPSYRFLRGLVAWHAGQRDAALALLQEVLAQSPGHRRAAEYLERWRSGASS